jgi:hypothetical protein
MRASIPLPHPRHAIATAQSNTAAGQQIACMEFQDPRDPPVLEAHRSRGTQHNCPCSALLCPSDWFPHCCRTSEAGHGHGCSRPQRKPVSAASHSSIRTSAAGCNACRSSSSTVASRDLASCKQAGRGQHADTLLTVDYTSAPAARPR